VSKHTKIALFETHVDLLATLHTAREGVEVFDLIWGSRAEWRNV